jgi:oxygen-dependent protoporphyrinogen oxidase
VAEAVVVGGGITGLTAAYRLSAAGVRVTLLEAGERLGGAIRTARVEGVTLEGGPDSLLTRKPWAEDLARALGLGPDLIATRPEARGASLWWRGRLHPIPAGVVNGVPTDQAAVEQASVLTRAGRRRVLADLSRRPTTMAGDVSVGDFLAERFGREWVERVAAPMLSGIYAGDIWHLSLAATAPQLAPVLARHGSLMRGLAAERRARPPAPGPVFRTLNAGLETLVDALAMRLAAGGVEVRLGTPVAAVTPTHSGVEVAWDGGSRRVDGVVMAAPAWAAGTILAEALPSAVEWLRGIAYANLAVVGLVYDAGELPVPRDQTGVLVPRQPGTSLTALTYLASKWAYRPAPPAEPIRAFYGRAREANVLERDDRELADAAVRDVARVLGRERVPRAVKVFRHPLAMPQYHVGHAERIAAIDREASRLPRVVLAGAWREGVGIPDCVRSGDAAAARLLAELGIKPVS